MLCAPVSIFVATVITVTGMEALCLENCGYVGSWWSGAKTKGREPTSMRKYVNGGLVMGRAGAIAAAYTWVLAQPAHYTDDQIGLAAYIGAHPAAWAPDDGSILVHNKHAGQRISTEERAGAGAYFLHYVGVSKMPPVFPIQEAWAAHSGPLAISRIFAYKQWDTIVSVLWVLVPLLLAALCVAAGYALGYARVGAPSSNLLGHLGRSSVSAASGAPLV